MSENSENNKSEKEGKSNSKNKKGEAGLRQKTAFFITPMSTEDSTIRRNANGLVSAVIRPVLEKLDILFVAPQEMDLPGNITKQVIRQIISVDVVIVDLTGLNPNVMYELAVRHARRLPVIVIAQHGTVIPFDLAAERTIYYFNDIAEVVQLTEQLSKTIPTALGDEQPDNPIYSGVESLLIQEEVSKSKDPIQNYLVERIDQLSEAVAYLKNSQQKKPDIIVEDESNPLPFFAKVECKEPVSREDIERSYIAFGKEFDESDIHIRTSMFNVKIVRISTSMRIPRNKIKEVIEGVGFTSITISLS